VRSSSPTSRIVPGCSRTWRGIARAGVDLDLVYVATRNRIVFGAADLDALRAALDVAA
jgi:hypothetical protein